MIHTLTREEAREVMKVFAVRMLRRIPGSGAPTGAKCYGSKMPNGRIYLSKSGTIGTDILGAVFHTGAIEGADFERLP
jgi:hypothetical protein